MTPWARERAFRAAAHRHRLTLERAAFRAANAADNAAAGLEPTPPADAWGDAR